jgi:hypothetical protein
LIHLIDGWEAPNITVNLLASQPPLCLRHHKLGSFQHSPSSTVGSQIGNNKAIYTLNTPAQGSQISSLTAQAQGSQSQCPNSGLSCLTAQAQGSQSQCPNSGLSCLTAQAQGSHVSLPKLRALFLPNSELFQIKRRLETSPCDSQLGV